MAQRRKRQRGVSWELLGIVALLGVFMVGVLIWLASPSARGGIEAPDFSSVNLSDAGPQAEPAATGTVADVSEPVAETAPAIPTGTTEDGRPFVGNADAPVTIYEFADFQCPHCKAYTVEDSKAIKTDFVARGTARIVFVNFPFLGDESRLAARAALCASEQGNFWDYHDWLFHNQATVSNSGGFSRDRLVQIAEGVGLDTAAFDTCLDDTAMADKVKADQDLGTQYGVNSTPSFLIDDQLLAGPALPTLREAIEKAAAAKE